MANCGSAQRNDVGGLGVSSILEMFEHLGLIGVLNLQPFALSVKSGGGIEIYLKNS